MIHDLRQKEIDQKIKKMIQGAESQLWMPSNKSLGRICLIILILWFISHIDFVFNKMIYPIHLKFLGIGLYNNLQGDLLTFLNNFPSLSIPMIDKSVDILVIDSAIGAVLIGFVFFVAQSLNGKEGIGRSKVLLYKSKLFPLIVIYILSFFFFWIETNIIGLLFIFFLAIATIKSLKDVINILINDYDMGEAEKKVILDILKSNMLKISDIEIKRRIGNNRLYKNNKNSQIFNVDIFGSRDEKDVILVKAKENGVISRINEKEFKKALLELNKYIKTTPTSSETNIYSKTVDRANTKQKPVCCMLVMLGSIIKPGDDLFAINKEIIKKPSKIKKISRLLQSIFELQKQDTEEKIHIEISKLKIKCLFSIKNNQSDELEKTIRLYKDIIEYFLSIISMYGGGGFSSDQAKEENSSFFDKLNSLDWIYKDIRDIIEAGLKSDDPEIVDLIMYLPVSIAMQAVDSKDHLVFQKFITLHQLFYREAYKLKGKKESKMIFDRTWRYLEEISKYYIASKLKEKDYPEDEIRAYFLEIIKVFQELLKASFDNKDIDNFKAFLSALSNISKKSYYDLDKDNKIVYKYIDEKREDMLFGLSSWILSILKDNIEDFLVKEFYDLTQKEIFSKIENVTAIFLRVHNFETDNFWGWNWWEIENREGVHEITILAKLERFFVIKSLSYLMSKNEEFINKIDLPCNRDLAFLAEGTREVKKMIDNIKKNPKEWDFVLRDITAEKCVLFEKLLEKAHREQEESDLNIKRSTKIDGEKVEVFKSKFIENYKSSHPIRILLASFGSYKNKIKHYYKGDLPKMGINTLFDKDVFFPDSMNWHIHHIGIDEAFGFGRSMAYGENESIIKKLLDISIKIDMTDFEKRLLSIKKSNRIILATNNAVTSFFEDSQTNKYIPKWSQLFPKEIFNNDDDEIEGVFNINNRGFVPVYQVYSDSNIENIFILDKTKIGEFIQYSPLDKKGLDKFMYDVFSIKIEDLSQEEKLIDNFIDKPPQWLINKGNIENQIKYLKENVLINISERFEFIPKKNLISYVVTFEKDDI